MFVVESVVVLFLFVVHSVDALVRVQQPHAQLEQRTLHKKKKKKGRKEPKSDTEKKVFFFFFCFFSKKNKNGFFVGPRQKIVLLRTALARQEDLTSASERPFPRKHTHTEKKKKKKEEGTTM